MNTMSVSECQLLWEIGRRSSSISNVSQVIFCQSSTCVNTVDYWLLQPNKSTEHDVFSLSCLPPNHTLFVWFSAWPPPWLFKAIATIVTRGQHMTRAVGSKSFFFWSFHCTITALRWGSVLRLHARTMHVLFWFTFTALWLYTSCMISNSKKI